MKKEIKELIAKNNLTDDQIEEALKAIKPNPPKKPAENPPATTPTIEEKEKEDKVEPETTSKETQKTSENSPDGTGEKDKPIMISKKDLDALLKTKIDEALASQPKAQPKLHPTIENPNRPKQYKELKKKQ